MMGHFLYELVYKGDLRNRTFIFKYFVLYLESGSFKVFYIYVCVPKVKLNDVLVQGRIQDM